MNIVKIIKASVKSIGVTLRKHAPEIMVVGGCLGCVGATILACKETTRVPDILDEGNKKLDEIENNPDKTDEKKEKAIVRVKTAGKLALNYLPSVALGAASIMSILGGHHILQKRHLITVAALADQADRFQKYRDRVKERIGNEVEQKLITGEHDEKVKETVKDPETGKEKNRNVTKTLLGENLDGRFQITMTRHNCYDISNDFDTNIARFRLINSELCEELLEQANFGNGKAIKTAKEVLERFGFKKADADWIKAHKNMGVVWTKEHPFGLDAGIDEAVRLHEFGVCPDHDEIHLAFNFVENVWDYV